MKFEVDWIQRLSLPGNPVGVFAFFTTRGKGGECSAPYGEFNLCHYVGDTPQHVSDSRSKLASLFGVETDNLVIPRQTHSVNVSKVDSIPVELNETDAVISSLDNTVIGVNTADCVPIILYDPITNLKAAIHAGWRGAVGGIVINTVRELNALGANLSNIIGAIGPCICTDCFEVGEEVASQFPEQFVIREKDVKPHVDLVGYVASQLTSEGIKQANINMSPKCTLCNSKTLFSARASGINSGRIFTGIISFQTSR